METCVLYNVGIITSTRDRPARTCLPLTAQEEVQHDRPRRTTIWQLSSGHLARPGWLCRSLPGPAHPAQPPSGDQGATYAPDGERGEALLPGSRDHCEVNSPLHCARLRLRCAG